ncbi:DUF6817 domain-containing protein [Bradyrhizobium sp. CB1015]|uniref:DUF6817 domain-containing protein n=1 Tax=Bradyrhizobium sp. CB1015 TaxID=2976822 RepID=UPI0021AA62B7|nr:hypothetical protein [Bradyrhizobium sp. CB1015]UWU92927.1 hypothetical protein N2604_02915 [Bradyrhizobium sp. CB1015]
MESQIPMVEGYRAALIRLGAHKIAHQDETLIDHLERTCRILQRMRCAEHVCVAGLFHGVYGTQALHAEQVEALPEGRRDEVRALIGEDAERLVFSFSVMSYDSLGRSLRSVLRPGGQPNLCDRRTGGAVPMTRAQFDELLQLKLGDVLAHIPARHTHSQLDMAAEYGAFWQMVAEHLGADAVETWNEIIGGVLWIRPERH